MWKYTLPKIRLRHKKEVSHLLMYLPNTVRFKHLNIASFKDNGMKPFS